MHPKSASVSSELDDLYQSYDYGDPQWHRMAAQAKARNILELTNTVVPKTTLDVGSGDGEVLAALHDLGFKSQFCAVDISRAALGRLEQRGLKQLKEARPFDGYAIPYPDKAFDLAIATHVLEHVEHERLFLAELARVAHFVFLEVPLENTIRLARNYRKTDTGHINFYSVASVRRLVQTCGFEVMTQRVFDIPLEIMGFRNKQIGLMKYSLRRGAVLLSANVASKIFTYHCGLLCRSPSR